MPNLGDLRDLTPQAIRESGGAAAAVPEDEIRWGMQALCQEGIVSELSGAVTICDNRDGQSGLALVASTFQRPEVP